ncbi:urease accessory protein UreD [Cohnella fermenti]|uniref:Urease accessory protein UreD n=1 Tax=Cohnella fermenti TaxID=2565925 RepID=A0A4S4C7U8_9BACL|nr:urease accessory protein UreD [Cohnella fermenti]THF83402.1 urease accessory protein UreD [Cohnella fermenti]
MPIASNTAIADRERYRTAVLDVSAAYRGDRTVLAGRYCTSPIKIAKTFPEDKSLCVMIMDASPGMLKGDRYEMQWAAEAGAQLCLTNQGFTKVHPCTPELGASMENRYRLAAGACIETMMKPIMLYKDASFTNRTVVELERGAVWMQGEALSPGRVLRGERFAYERLDNRISVYYEGELIHHQKQLVRPGRQLIAAPGAWETYSHLGTFLVFSDRVDTALLESVRAVLDRLPFSSDQLYAGAAMTYRHGLTVTAAASSSWIVQHMLKEVWNEVRQTLLHLQPSRIGSVG